MLAAPEHFLIFSSPMILSSDAAQTAANAQRTPPDRRETVSMLSFSTSWNSERGKPAKDIVQEILDLGFDAIELGHGLTAPTVHEMLELRKKMPFVVSSLHNFCPLPPEVMVDQPDCYEFTSARDEPTGNGPFV